MKTVLCSLTALILAAGSAAAEDGPVAYQCQVAAQAAGDAQSEPFSIEVKGNAVKLEGVNALDSSFSLIRKNDAFYVFKNARGQGGNINRSNGVVELYALNAAAHKLTVSITGTCVKQD